MNETIQILNKLMDVSALRQRVLANNLANINTPGFKRQEVQFRDALSDAIQSGDAQKIDGVQPVIVEDRTSPSRPDGNTVSVQDEMALMSDNSLLYQFSGKLINSKFDRLKSAIKGR